MSEKQNEPNNQIDKALSEAGTVNDAEQFRLRQAEELLRRCGYVPIPNSDEWCLPEDLPSSEGPPD